MLRTFSTPLLRHLSALVPLATDQLAGSGCLPCAYARLWSSHSDDCSLSFDSDQQQAPQQCHQQRWCSGGVWQSPQTHDYHTSAAAASAPAAASAAVTGRSTPLSPPWTPTRLLQKRKVYQKRMRHLMLVLEAEQVARVQEARPLPEFSAGDILEVQVVVPEAERKVYTYRGVCIGRAHKGPRSWFKIYNVFPDVGGFVQHFPLYMPDLVDVRVVGRLPKARRAKLYHLLQDETNMHTYQQSVPPPK